MWLYGHSTLYGNITRDFVQITISSAATTIAEAGTRSAVASSFSSDFYRACFNGLKPTMPESRTRLLWWVYNERYAVNS